MQSDHLLDEESYELRDTRRLASAHSTHHVFTTADQEELDDSLDDHDIADHLHEHSHVHHMTAEEKKLMQTYESLDYDVPANELYRKERMSGDYDKKSVTIENTGRWLIFGAVGLSTGILAFILSLCVEKLSEWKFDQIEDRVQDGELAAPFFIFFFISLFFVLISTFLVAVIEPVAGGSGIPEIKGYLNGTNYLRFLRVKTLIVKAVGVVFSVSGGLIIGKEGPLVHSGAVIAANLSNATFIHKMKCWSPKWHNWITRFKNDRDKRDFVAGGAAAGVAAAFGAPVGGILFSLEEASSFWSTRLTWMVFLCSALGTFALNTCKAIRTGKDDFSGLISFGPPLTEAPYHLWETPFFVIMAFAGGVFGAAFNHINERICKWRRDRLQGNPGKRMLEAVSIAGITALLAFWGPYFFEHCTAVKDYAENKEFYSPYRCKDTEFNTMATVLFTTTESSIRGFFHNSSEYDWRALIGYFFIIFFLAVITYGIAVPSGLFVPCILMGCAFGRLFGELLRSWLDDESILPGTYAVMGATAMLGGVARMTISLTVILLETTQDVQFIMPIMLVLIISKWVGDLFNISLYDLHVELKCMPFVESQPSTNMYHLTAGEIMSKPATCMFQTLKVSEILTVLKQCNHNGFPVVSKSGTFAGIILRNQLNVLINKRAFGPPEEAVGRVSLDDFATSLSSKKKRLEMLADKDMEQTMDLSAFMNPVPVAVQPECPLSRVFTLFRSLGIRHLCVVDHSNVPIGVITRKEIMSSFDQDLF